MVLTTESMVRINEIIVAFLQNLTDPILLELIG